MNAWFFHTFRQTFDWLINFIETSKVLKIPTEDSLKSVIGNIYKGIVMFMWLSSFLFQAHPWQAQLLSPAKLM